MLINIGGKIINILMSSWNIQYLLIYKRFDFELFFKLSDKMHISRVLFGKIQFGIKTDERNTLWEKYSLRENTVCKNAVFKSTGQALSPNHSDQIFERPQVSWISS